VLDKFDDSCIMMANQYFSQPPNGSALSCGITKPQHASNETSLNTKLN